MSTYRDFLLFLFLLRNIFAAGRRESAGSEARVGKTITALTRTARQFEVMEIVGRERLKIMTGTCDVGGRISVITERKVPRERSCGRKRRTRRARWGCTACASDVEGFVVVVVVIVGFVHSVIYGETLRATDSFFHAVFPLASSARDECLAETRWRILHFSSFTLLLTSEHLVQRTCDLSRHPRPHEGRAANNVICAAAPTTLTCITARNGLCFEAMRILWED